MTLANLIRVKRSTARAYQSADASALLATGEAANCGAAKRSAGDRQFVTMFLPE